MGSVYMCLSLRRVVRRPQRTRHAEVSENPLKRLGVLSRREALQEAVPDIATVWPAVHHRTKLKSLVKFSSSGTSSMLMPFMN